MLSTLARQADLHLKLPAWAYRASPRSPLLIRYRTSDQQMFGSAGAPTMEGRKERKAAVSAKLPGVVRERRVAFSSIAPLLNQEMLSF